MDLEDNEVHSRILCSSMAIVEKEAKELHMSISLPAQKAIGDMVIQYLEILARDLELFAQHAGRKSVNVDDVLLCARRNPDVAAKLLPLVQELKKASKDKKDQKLKRKKNSNDSASKPDQDGAGNGVTELD